MRAPKPPKRKRGRPAFKPLPRDRRAVEEFARSGTTKAQIARIMGIDEKTLAKYFSYELETGRAMATHKVAMALYEKALGNGPQSVTACIFWLKARAGWKETHVVQSDGAITGVLRVPEPIDADQWVKTARKYQSELEKQIDRANRNRNGRT